VLVFFDLSPLEIVVLLGMSIVLFGPDKLPGAAMSAARVLRQIRALAETSRAQVREQLGPEFADLSLDQLDPRKFVREHLGEELGQMRGVLDDVGRDLRSGPADQAARTGPDADAAEAGRDQRDQYADAT
jgi:sec-independent protein translocase protein TatB